MATYRTPGIYREEVFPALAPELRTGVPAFLGTIRREITGVEEQSGGPKTLTLWTQFEEGFGELVSKGYLADAVHGFFQNEGRLCCVHAVYFGADASAISALHKGLDALASVDAIDLVCAPDIMWLYQQGELSSTDNVLQMQSAVLEHCDAVGDRFAILDSLPGADVQQVLAQRGRLSGTNGALYFPWLGTGERGGSGKLRFVPPCGHVAGVYARSDQRVGVHKAPANEVLEDVLDVESIVNSAKQEELNPEGVNCLRSFPGRGIRVWGARTLSREAAWEYINVRRLFLTAGRWIERNLADVTFEPNDEMLWARIVRELTVYFQDLFERGALKGRTAREAFYVKCDAETNPLNVRDAGMVVTEIGLAPAAPAEFVVVRIIHGESGVTITGPTRPE